MEKVKQEMVCYPVGDCAMAVEYGNSIDEKTNKKVQFLTAYLEKGKLKGIREVLPTYRSLLIFYDPDKICYKKLVKKIEHCGAKDGLEYRHIKKIIKIPCLYNGEDLEEMEKITGLSSQEIINIHSGTDYRIYMLGFLPGFVYLGGLDERIHAPRLKSPRLCIEPGSVGIGGGQTGIYPMASPGGWRLIGKTPLRMYDVNRKEPFLCKAGEYIRFVPIEERQYEEIQRKVKTGEYEPEWMTMSEE